MRFTPDQLAAAVEVRTLYGWFSVIRANTRTVTVVGDLTDLRIPVKTVLEIR